MMLGLFVLLLMGALWLQWVTTMSEGTKWDLMAASMDAEGYTDLEIYLELGPRPRDDSQGK